MTQKWEIVKVLTHSWQVSQWCEEISQWLYLSRSGSVGTWDGPDTWFKTEEAARSALDNYCKRYTPSS